MVALTLQCMQSWVWSYFKHLEKLYEFSFCSRHFICIIIGLAWTIWPSRFSQTPHLSESSALAGSKHLACDLSDRSGLGFPLSVHQRWALQMKPEINLISRPQSRTVMSLFPWQYTLSCSSPLLFVAERTGGSHLLAAWRVLNGY